MLLVMPSFATKLLRRVLFKQANLILNPSVMDQSNAINRFNSGYLNPKSKVYLKKLNGALRHHLVDQGRPDAITLKSEFKDRAIYNELRTDVIHLRDYCEHYRKATASPEEGKTHTETKADKKANRYHNDSFTIRIWKRTPRDVFLGSAVSCCLAVDGGEFQAMVERLMDVGMGVIEIVDKAGNTVALSWVFLATDQKGNPYLISNFHEMSNKIVGISELRDFLIAELTEYSKALAKKLSAGYLIRPLEYGMIPDFTTVKPVDNVELKKIGGFFKFENYKSSANKTEILKEEKDEEDPNYYLESLKLRKFWGTIKC